MKDSCSIKGAKCCLEKLDNSNIHALTVSCSDGQKGFVLVDKNLGVIVGI